jgi:hypothetical protein
VQRCTVADIDWLYELALRVYGERIKDRPAVRRWLAGVLPVPQCFIARTEDAAFIACLQPLFYDPAPELRGLFLASEARGPWQMLQLLRAAVDWGAANGCRVFRMSPDVPIDFGPLLRRLGCKVVHCDGYMVSING